MSNHYSTFAWNGSRVPTQTPSSLHLMLMASLSFTLNHQTTEFGQRPNLQGPRSDERHTISLIFAVTSCKSHLNSILPLRRVAAQRIPHLVIILRSLGEL